MIKFIFVKVAQYLILPPTSFIIAIALFRKFKKIVLSLTIIFLLLSTKYIASWLLYPLEKDYFKDINKTAEAVVVLGGGYNINAPNLAIKEGAFKRLVYAIMLAKKSNLPIIFNGSKEEAIIVAKTLKELNKSLDLNLSVAKGKFIKRYQIYIQNNALNTIDNAKYVKAFFNKNKITNPKIYLVTSAYHMKRALKEFKLQNINPIPKATDFRSTKEIKFINFLPTADGLNLSSIALHEYLAFLRDFILNR